LEEASIETSERFPNKIDVDEKLQEEVEKVLNIVSNRPLCNV
jgi:hypothetical protein